MEAIEHQMTSIVNDLTYDLNVICARISQYEESLEDTQDDGWVTEYDLHELYLQKSQLESELRTIRNGGVV